jgi:hypothetical protein
MVHVLPLLLLSEKPFTDDFEWVLSIFWFDGIGKKNDLPLELEV